jgi:hypothetical protein
MLGWERTFAPCGKLAPWDRFLLCDYMDVSMRRATNTFTSRSLNGLVRFVAFPPRGLSWAGKRVVSLLLIIGPSVVHASLPLGPTEILCNSNLITVARVLNATTSRCTFEPQLDEGNVCVQRSLRVDISIERSLGMSHTDREVPKVGDIRSVIVALTATRFPEYDGTLHAPDGMVRSKSTQLESFIRGKTFIFSISPPSDMDGKIHAGIWHSQSEPWVKGMLIAEAHEALSDDCPKPAWMPRHPKYTVDSPAMDELLKYQHDLIVARFDHPAEGRFAPAAATIEGLSLVTKEIDREFLSDREIDQLLDFYRSAVGQQFVSLQHQLQPIVTEADAAAQSHYGPRSTPRLDPPPDASLEMAQFITLALSQQYWSSNRIDIPTGIHSDPLIAAIAVTLHSEDLEQMRREYLGYLKAFSTFRHSAELRDLLEAGRIAYLLCETTKACTAGPAE